MLRSRSLLVLVALMSIPSFCRASEHILFSRLAPSEARLFISNADGSGERALTQSGSLDYNPTWSPSGGWTVFTSERAGSADLYRIHSDGTGLERLTDDPAYDDQGAPSPDSKRVVFVSTRAGGRANFWLLDVATRKAQPLTSGDGGDFRPAWSPDGEQIVFTSSRMGFKDEALNTDAGAQPYSEIFVMRYDGTQVEQLTDNQWEDGGPAWQPHKADRRAAAAVR
jgi:TolB protein